MQSSRANVLTRHDTLLGICEALGEDLHFNPVYLRVALSVGLLWNPVAMIATYLGAGVVVGLVRWLVPLSKARPQTTRTSKQALVIKGPTAPAVEDDLAIAA